MKKLTKNDAQFTTTPFVVEPQKDKDWNRYFPTLKKAILYQNKNGGDLYQLDRSTGEWEPPTESS